MVKQSCAQIQAIHKHSEVTR